MNDVIRALCLLMFGTTDVFSITIAVLSITGLWRLLQKSGLKGWWALIPGAREYQLSRCAGREPEGRVYSVVTVALLLLGFVTGVLIPLGIDGLTEEEMTEMLMQKPWMTFMAIAVIPLAITQFIYGIRVWSGLVNVYGLRKRWMWLISPLISFLRSPTRRMAINTRSRM